MTINSMGRSALDCFHDLGQLNHDSARQVEAGRKDQMRMVRHNNRSLELVPNAIIVTATIQNNIARPIRQDHPMLGDEGDKVRLCVTLQVRQVAAIEGHREIVAPSRPLGPKKLCGSRYPDSILAHVASGTT